MDHFSNEDIQGFENEAVLEYDEENYVVNLVIAP